MSKENMEPCRWCGADEEKKIMIEIEHQDREESIYFCSDLCVDDYQKEAE
jgi:hypothetical protein